MRRWLKANHTPTLPNQPVPTPTGRHPNDGGTQTLPAHRPKERRGTKVKDSTVSRYETVTLTRSQTTQLICL